MTTDAELYRRWVDEKDCKAGAELIDRHTGKLYRWLLSRTAEPDDAAQATWVAAMRAGSYAGRGCFQAWLQRVAASELRRGRRGPVELRERTATTPSRAVLRAELAEAAEGLSHDGQREVVRMVLEGHEPHKIAERLDVPVKTVWSRLRAATTKLRERLTA